MHIHEYQAKTLFNQFGIKTPEGVLISTVEQSSKACSELGGPTNRKSSMIWNMPTTPYLCSMIHCSALEKRSKIWHELLAPMGKHLSK
jgi:hypothetical protein